jgi:NAD(P)H-flavin reductase
MDQGDEWYVKGPMGLGMDVDTNGHNIVFTGGTGILVFLDLVAKIALQNCGAN